MRITSILLALATSVSALELTPDNWAEKTKDKQARAGATGNAATPARARDKHTHHHADAVFIKFFAPWCGHCQKLAPAWQKLMDAYEGDEHRVVAEVDCTSDGGKELCQKYGVSGYPSLMYGAADADPLEKYEGQRGVPDLDAFAKTLGPSCEGGYFELCDAKQMKRVDAFRAMGSDQLTAFIEGIYEQLLRVEGTAAQGFQKLQLLYDAYKLDGEERIALVQPSLDLAKDVMASLAPVAAETNATGEL